MIKIVLVFNLLLSLLFSFTTINKNEENVELLTNSSTSCRVEDSIVNITTKNNLISVSGIIITKNSKYVYIATSYKNYHKGYNYEIIFSDFSRKEASVVGGAIEDGVLFLKVETNENYCSVNYSRSELIDKGETVDIYGAFNYQTVYSRATIDEIGICNNCNEETYKHYYHSRITVDLDNYFYGAGVFDIKGQLLGIVIEKEKKYQGAISVLDVNKLVNISFNLINNKKYHKNYIKYNLLNVNSLTKEQKYLYSLDEEITQGVLVSSLHYLNYFIGGLNQGMVIYEVEGIRVNNCYEFDNEIAKYKKNSKIEVRVRTINNKDRIYRVKI